MNDQRNHAMRESLSCAEHCARTLQDYAAAHGFIPAQVTWPPCRAWCPPNHIATREEAFGYALAMLQSYLGRTDPSRI